MSATASAEPCADCLELVARVSEWGSRYPGYDSGVWSRVLGPHPHLTRVDGNPVRCEACGCCWSLIENPDCGYVYLDRLSEREYRRQMRPSRWNPPFWEGRWGTVVLLYVPLLLANVGLAIAVAWYATRDAGWDRAWPAVALLSVLSIAAAIGLARVIRRK